MKLINKLTEFVLSMLEDENGGTSTMRVVVSLGTLIIVSVWAFLSIKNNNLISFEAQDLGLIGLFLGSKVFQKRIEANEAIKLNKK